MSLVRRSISASMVATTCCACALSDSGVFDARLRYVATLASREFAAAATPDEVGKLCCAAA
jgi:hypothetical protein